MMTLAEARRVPAIRDWRHPYATNLYRLYDARGTLLYVGITLRPLYHRFNAHARTKAWWPQVAGVAVQQFTQNHLALDAERTAIATERPLYNLRSASGAPPERLANDDSRRSGPIHDLACARGSGSREQGAGVRGHGTEAPLLTKANVDTREDSLVTVGQVIDAGLWASGERHDVVRTGDRAEIPRHIRAAVWFRDKGRCRLCHPDTPLGEWHLDHIKPWSAGGSDRSDNLRVLCAMHNLQRSNRRIGEERPESPVTWWCERCYMRDEHTWRYAPSLPPECPTHMYVRAIKSTHLIDPRCRVQRLYAKALDTLTETGGEFNDWHNRRDGLTELHTTAYCAHCDLRGLTGWPL